MHLPRASGSEDDRRGLSHGYRMIQELHGVGVTTWANQTLLTPGITDDDPERSCSCRVADIFAIDGWK